MHSLLTRVARFFLVQNSKIQQNIPNGQKYQLPDPPKVTQIEVFGLKTNHLATLLLTTYAIIFLFPYTLVGFEPKPAVLQEDAMTTATQHNVYLRRKCRVYNGQCLQRQRCRRVHRAFFK
jgi:hypothetical protein